jgi:uncharacterized protein YbbC (DUF1343 family)
MDTLCYGIDLRKVNSIQEPVKQIQLNWLIDFYKDLNRTDFFDRNFNYHSGNDLLQNQIKEGKTEEEIRATWKKDIETFKAIRKKYLLYKDFE